MAEAKGRRDRATDGLAGAAGSRAPMREAEPKPWRASYPPGIDADARIEPATVPGLFRKAIAAHGPRPALSYRDAELSYDELGARVARIAAALRRGGLGRGGTLALYLPNCPFHPVFFYAALSIGARVAHLSPLDAFRELEHKCLDSGADALVTLNLPPMAAMAERLAEAGAVGRVILCDDAEFGAPAAPLAPLPARADFIDCAGFCDGLPAAPPLPDDMVAPDDVALIQYTGGTTGLPKGAMLTHGNLTAGVEIYDLWNKGFDQGGATDREVALLVLPLFHIYAIIVLLLRQMQEGALLLLRMRFDPAQVLDDIERRRVTLFPGVPTMWTALVNMPGVEARDLSSLRNVGSGGAPLPVEVHRRFQKLTGLSLGGGWGMTETCSAGTAHLQVPDPAKTGSIGLPLPGLDLKIVALDDAARTLPLGESGEIAIRGPNITRGYLNRPEAAAEAFADGWLLTGDVGRIDSDGYVWLVDRKKDLIISGGFNVYPQMIEQAIYEHPAVAETVVVGIPDAYRGESARAYVTLRPGAERFSLEELRDFLADRLGRHELPASLEFRDALPRTSVGKLSRKDLRDEARAQSSAGG